MRIKKLLKAPLTLPPIRRFTIESVTRFAYHGSRTLIEKLSMFPNYGQGFKIWLKKRPVNYYIVDYIRIKNNRHAKLFGIFYNNGKPENKIKKIRNTLKEGAWDFSPVDKKCYSDNGVEYNIKKTEDLIKEKYDLLLKRNTMLGFMDEFRKKRIEERLKKRSLKAAPTKKR